MKLKKEKSVSEGLVLPSVAQCQQPNWKSLVEQQISAKCMEWLWSD